MRYSSSAKLSDSDIWEYTAPVLFKFWSQVRTRYSTDQVLFHVYTNRTIVFRKRDKLFVFFLLTERLTRADKTKTITAHHFDSLGRRDSFSFRLVFTVYICKQREWGSLHIIPSFSAINFMLNWALSSCKFATRQLVQLLSTWSLSCDVEYHVAQYWHWIKTIKTIICTSGCGISLKYFKSICMYFYTIQISETRHIWAFPKS